MSPTFSWLRQLAAACLLGGLGSLGARPALAQAPALPYDGPRYPGGPDSLRAAVARQLRAANPAWAGTVLLRLTLDDAGNVRKSSFLPPPPGTPAATLVRNADVRALAEQLVQRQPRWQPGPPVASSGPPAAWLTEPTLLLVFGGASAGAVPLAYSDEYPTFPAFGGRDYGSWQQNLRAFLQKQIRYPAEALRSQQQGTVYAYFEVSETGAVENRHVVGSVSAALDTEVERVLGDLPPARTPPRQQGQPVRVYYVLPLAFKIQ